MSESRPDSDIVIGVFFNLVELPDYFNAFCIIDQDALNGIIQMLSEFIIRQAAHPSDRLLLRCCREALLMVGFILSFAFIKLLFQGSLFCCEDILARYSSAVSLPSRYSSYLVNFSLPQASY